MARSVSTLAIMLTLCTRMYDTQRDVLYAFMKVTRVIKRSR